MKSSHLHDILSCTTPRTPQLSHTPWKPSTSVFRVVLTHFSIMSKRKIVLCFYKTVRHEKPRGFAKQLRSYLGKTSFSGLATPDLLQPPYTAALKTVIMYKSHIWFLHTFCMESFFKIASYFKYAHWASKCSFVMQLDNTEKRNLASRKCIQLKFYQDTEMYVYNFMKI